MSVVSGVLRSGSVAGTLHSDSRLNGSGGRSVGSATILLLRVSVSSSDDNSSNSACSPKSPRRKDVLVLGCLAS